MTKKMKNGSIPVILERAVAGEGSYSVQKDTESLS